MLARYSFGFSLIETAMVVLLLGVVAAAMAPTLTLIGPVTKKGTTEIQQSINAKLAQGYLEFVRSGKQLTGQTGVTIANPVITYNPAAAGQLNYAVVSPADTDPAWVSLSSIMQAQGIAVGQVGSDGSAAENLRVSQIIATTHSLPLFVNTGPSVTLTYNYGVIYSTTCSRVDVTCNPGTRVPSSSAVLAAGNFTTWAPSGTDFAPAAWSTLTIQREKLEQTSARLDKIRESFRNYFKTKQNAVSDVATATTTNYYPNSQVTTDNTAAVAGATAAERQYCWDGWYDLAAASSSDPTVGNGILNKIGLSPEEFGKTSWTGKIEFCRDYDPTGTKGRGVAPFWGALRVLRTISTGGIPDVSISTATADSANALVAF